MAKKTSTRKAKKSKVEKKDIAATYNAFKLFGGQQYTGMKIGRSHKWYYDKGVWRDKKITPDEWEISYAVTKRRAGKAPKGSGVPVGTEYHWFIVAHQHVKKLNANDYSTELTGYKYKVAHKRFDKEKWSASDAARRRRMIRFLKEMIMRLESEQDETANAPEQKPARVAKLSAPKKDRKAPRGTSSPRTGKRSTAKTKVPDEAM